MTGTTPPSRIPAPLDTLGRVFVPIDPREKGTTRPRTNEHLYAPDDPVLKAYLEAGHNYGVACQNGLAVLDADEPETLQDAINALPETAWQVSGSGEGEHYFLQVPGFDEDLKLYHPETDAHLGEVKGATQSYVVGPGSIHPSGGRYGPLHGETIATVEADELRDVLKPFLRESTRARGEFDHDAPSGVTRNGAASGDDVDLSVFDVVSAGRYPEGERREHPFHGSSTGVNFMVDDRGETFRCWRHDCTGNGLHLVGIEQGIIDCGEWLPSGLDSDTWSEIFAAAREAGYDLPEFDPGDAGEPVALLPGTPKARALEWDWRNGELLGEDGPTDPTLTIDAARERTTDRIADAYQYADRVLVEALPTMGKSYGSVAAAAETDVPVTLLTTRGHKEQYAQLREWCDEHALEAYTLPSFTHHCDTANGEHGEEWRERVMDWYRRGATPKEIHMHAESELGRPLPCQEHEGECPYTARWRFDPDEYDALIGHYSHAYKRKVTQGRAVVFDEFPGDTYETRLDTMLPGAVTAYLQATPEVPFADYTDLIEHRDDEQRRADALAWFHDEDLERDGLQVFDDAAGHAAAPLAVFTLLAGVGDDLGNGWERADLGEHGVGLHDREQGAVYVLSPPPLEYVRSVVALDGTPTPALWKRALGIELNHRPVLTEGERAEYVRDVLGLDLVRTTEAVKPYNSADHVSVDRDAALLEAIAEEHDERPAVITTATAEQEYEQAEVTELVTETEHYGNVLGSNAFAETRVGAVIGSNHYGDHYIEKWGAYEGEPVARGDGKGTDLSYGPFGDDVLTHMREHETLQAAMRFGRDGHGATVYVHTNTLPEWVPVAGEGRVLTTWSDGMREILDVARDLEAWTTAELAAEVSIGERTVRDHLHRLVDAGVLSVEYEGRGYVWRDDGLHRVNDHGEVELAPVDVDDLAAEQVAEVGRSSTYTWNLRNSAGESAGSTRSGESATTGGVATASNGGDRPPDDGV